MVAKSEDRERHYAEKVGLVCEQMGMPRMAGRIVGWLLTCDPAHVSLVDLADELQASKASISTMTRMLMNHGLLERVSIPGQRRDYVRIVPNAWSLMMARMQREARMMRELAEEGLSVLASSPPERRTRLEEMRDLYAFLEEEAPQTLKRWERTRSRKRS